MPENAYGQPIGGFVDAARFPRSRPPRTPMIGRTCVVVPFDDAHIPGLHAAFSAPGGDRGWTYLSQEPFASQAGFAAWAKATCHGDDPMFHTVLLPDGTPAGFATFMRIDPANGVIETGNIHLSPMLQGTTAATEAFFVMMRRAFDELGYRRYEWKCDALNAPSRKAAARLGFICEGTFRQAIHYKGRNRDTAWFSIIDADWPGVRAAFEAWLAPENFDADGAQKTPLTVP